jgi:hypothetical protein
VKDLTVTTTARSITAKQLLLGTVTDQVCWLFFEIITHWSAVWRAFKSRQAKKQNLTKGEHMQTLWSYWTCLPAYVNLLHLQVLALDKRLLDPCRSPTPTASEWDEGILPLTDAIPISQQVCYSRSSFVMFPVCYFSTSPIL